MSILSSLDIVGPKLLSTQGQSKSHQWENLASVSRQRKSPPQKRQTGTAVPQYRVLGSKYANLTSSAQHSNNPARRSSDDDSGYLPVPDLSVSQSRAKDRSVRTSSSIQRNVVDAVSSVPKSQPKKQSTTKGMTSSFLTPSRDKYLSPEMRNALQTPGFFRYRPEYKAIDSEKSVGPKGFQEESAVFKSEPRDSTVRTHFFTTPTLETKKLDLSATDATATRKDRYDNARSSSPFNKTRNSTAEKSLEKTGTGLRQSAVFASTSHVRTPTPKLLESQEIFYTSHDTNTEVISTRPRTVSLPLGRVDRDNQPRTRTEKVMVDKTYDVSLSGHRNTKNGVLDMRKSEGRKGLYAGDAGFGTTYNFDDRVLSKRPRTVSATLSHTLGTPVVSTRSVRNVTAVDSSVDDINDLSLIDKAVRRKGRQPTKFGRPTTPQFISSSLRKKNQYLPTDTVDINGNPLPSVTYDCNMDTIKTRSTIGSVPFSGQLAHIISMPNEGLTSDLDYSPDLTIGINDATSKRLTVSQSLAESYSRYEKKQLAISAARSKNIGIPEALTSSVFISPDSTQFNLISSNARQHRPVANFSRTTSRDDVNKVFTDPAADRFYNTGIGEKMIHPSTNLTPSMQQTVGRETTPSTHFATKTNGAVKHYHVRDEVTRPNIKQANFSAGRIKESSTTGKGLNQNSLDTPFYDVKLTLVKPTIPSVTIAPE
ncbi:hypothetical protein BLNAU_7593 [Blattamonas nauphoetae]|uniref:Uncharacterized protein n=1 Tax=Blattamonas nauphoetae TaxID=2049346 RepID=A0ABQ9Y130_9EUKA|nr:hypothetical protein BLNAU_7593 [Blattamonas nauphoetae]